MADQFRDSCVDRQNKKRKEFRGNPVDPIRVSFYDKDGQRINDVTRNEANCIAKLNPPQKFYFQDGNGYQRELLINDVNALSVIDALPQAPACPSNPQPCGPPRVQFFGGMGMGAMANAVISPNSKAIIGFDIVNPGFNYLSPPFANLVDECGKGSGGTLLVQMNGQSVKNIVITAPGDGYLPAPDGSLGGNGRVWKNPEDGYVEKSDGGFYVVPSPQITPQGEQISPPTPGVETIPPERGVLVPENLPEGATYYPPESTKEQLQQVLSYPVITEIEEIYIMDPGFGYEPGDTLEVISTDGTNGGAELRPIINDRGEINEVKVIKPGSGFIDLPEININSIRGFNAKLIPVLKVTPLSQIADIGSIPANTQIISVVDCVGRILPQDNFDIVIR